MGTLRLGCSDYDAQGLLGLLRCGGRDAATKLPRQLTATKLNLAVGSDPVILPVVQEADACLAAWPPGRNPRRGAWWRALVLKDLLDE